jgi:hypothetical protein
MPLLSKAGNAFGIQTTSSERSFHRGGPAETFAEGNVDTETTFISPQRLVVPRVSRKRFLWEICIIAIDFLRHQGMWRHGEISVANSTDKLRLYDRSLASLLNASVAIVPHVVSCDSFPLCSKSDNGFEKQPSLSW